MYLMNAVGLRGESGTIDRILLVEQNITKQKQAEENIRHALVKEQELGELKSRFVSMASHEFRTPLSTILSSANLLRKYLDMDVSLEKQEKHLRRIKSSVKNLTGILNDFLSLDKLQEGKIEATPSHWNIKDLISDIVDEMSDVRKEGQEVVYSHSAGSEEVYLDQNVLRNVVINLLSNAIKYSAANQSVRLESSVKRKRLYLEVEDQGIGIPKAEQKHLFERFFRAKNAINLDGTGLGLNIVNKYLELLGGKITFESEEGKGTKFFVSIPIIE
jgi:signal transduction histidine kinase